MDSVGYIAVEPAQCCTDERHAFLTTLIPPRADQLCECGAQTWRQACEDARLHLRIDSETKVVL